MTLCNAETLSEKTRLANFCTTPDTGQGTCWVPAGYLHTPDSSFAMEIGSKTFGVRYIRPCIVLLNYQSILTSITSTNLPNFNDHSTIMVSWAAKLTDCYLDDLD